MKKHDLVVNTEHGPKGGDEINFNYLNFEIPNYGWDIASYGTTLMMKKYIKIRIQNLVLLSHLNTTHLQLE